MASMASNEIKPLVITQISACRLKKPHSLAATAEIWCHPRTYECPTKNSRSTVVAAAAAVQWCASRRTTIVELSISSEAEWEAKSLPATPPRTGVQGPPPPPQHSKATQWKAEREAERACQLHRLRPANANSSRPPCRRHAETNMYVTTLEQPSPNLPCNPLPLLPTPNSYCRTKYTWK